MITLLLYLPFWLLPLLLWILLRRHAYRVCPCYFAYVAFGVAADTARFITLNHPHPYYATYWLTEAGYCLLGILAMYEVLRAVFMNLPRAWWHHLALPVILLVSAEMSVARTQAATARFGSGLDFYIVTGEVAVRFAQVFVFAVVATLVAIFGLRWRQYFFGVAAGFGFYATVMLLTTTEFADKGKQFKLYWGISSVAAYSVATLIWIWFFAMPPKGTDPESQTLGPLLG
jgi:hypothetical protein